MIDSLRSSLRFVLTSFSIDQTGEMAHRWMPKTQDNRVPQEWLKLANFPAA
jgi:hypothetical protein